MIDWTVLVPMIIYLIGMIIVALYAGKARAKHMNFVDEYFLGSKSFGGLIIAMTLVVTFASGSSFLGGPGAAAVRGYGWVYLAMIQVPTAYLVLGVLGKKFAIISRRINAVTILDVLRARYKSPFFIIISAIAIILFFIGLMAAQWMAGATLINSLTGLSYKLALLIFALTVLFYVTFGGFRAVVITDLIQGIVMFFGGAVLMIAAISAGGGVNALTSGMAQIEPGLISPYGPAKDVLNNGMYTVSFWILVGFGLLGLPHVCVRAMAYKDSKSMGRAMIIGTIVVGFLMLALHITGAWGRVLVPGVTAGQIGGDRVIPEVAKSVMPGWLAGIVLAAPLAAIMSTVDSVLILVSSTIVKDVYISYLNPKPKDATVKTFSITLTALLAVIVFLFSLNKTPLIVTLNLFALGGLEAAFVWPMLLGLFWKRANTSGAIAGLVVGVGSYIAFTRGWFGLKPILGTHPVGFAVVFSLVAFVIVALLTKKPDEKIIQLFWGAKPVKD